MGTSAKPCTGSIQEKNGVWYTVIQVTINGRRRSKWETTRLRANGNKRKALAILDERKYQYVQKFMSGRSGNLDRGVDNNILFSDFLQIWIDSQRANVSSITSGSRESMLNSRIRGFFDHRGITLQQLSPADIEGFYNNLRHDGRSGSTLIHYHQFMNQALEAAVRKDILLKNPMKKVDRPKRQQVAGQFYSKQEVEQLLALFENDPLYALIVVAVYYGMGAVNC
jgi:integrase